ncbi:dTDP-4-dehydrorhamnose reductase [Dietzia natronolimnaea]|uniref:dTDP-4-dehydrorhamnose reductase n=1 Tax=Dietzia natronolimnaea TaxID=161920 RepID=A0A2A2WPV4_9ACTN|nr:dTDP-4-dehydrorhamnose reductase [Dietzia natronolimnaea]PAY23201.1 dTDP-4-dehydrorhamnose reductase [Dietzia natronolimnaea]
MGSGDSYRPTGLVRILVTGGRGQLGHALSGVAHAPGRGELNITDHASIAAALERHDPEVVINAAAYTDVDGAESDEAGARAINTDGAGSLAVACRDRGIRLIHISTDYVFSGEVPGGGDPATAPALQPDDPAAPRTAYGRTKLAGEQSVLSAHPEATIVRTAWLYTGPNREKIDLAGSDFVATMVRLERERDQLTVVDDQWGSPTSTQALAGGLLEMLAAEKAGRVDTRGLTLHAAGGGRATWCELAREAFRRYGADPDRIRPCSSSEFPRPAPRPTFSVLSDASWRAAGLAPLPDWRADLSAAIAEHAHRARGGRDR